MSVILQELVCEGLWSHSVTSPNNLTADKNGNVAKLEHYTYIEYIFL